MNIPDEDHITRYISFTKIHDIENCIVDGEAFRLKLHEHGIEAISVNWIEHSELPNRTDQITRIFTVLKNKFSSNSLSSKSFLGVLNVSGLKRNVETKSADKRKLKIVHNPAVNDLSHSQVSKIKKDEDKKFLDLIAENISELHQVENYIKPK